MNIKDPLTQKVKVTLAFIMGLGTTIFGLFRENIFFTALGLVLIVIVLLVNNEEYTIKIPLVFELTVKKKDKN